MSFLKSGNHKARVILFAITLTLIKSEAATNDVTGITPTMHITFNADSYVIDNGTATFTSSSLEGTSKYLNSPNGRAIHAGPMRPYFTINNLTTADAAYTVSTYATLGAVANGIIWSLRNASTATSLVLRRGANVNECVVTTGVTTNIVMSLPLCTGGDHTYHHYVLVVQPSGTTIYVDGYERATTVATEMAKRDKMQFGSRTGGLKVGETFGDGYLDDFRVYDAALSDAQILALCQELSSKGSEPGSISIKTGIRTTNNSHINHLPSNALMGALPIPRTSWNHTPQFADDKHYDGALSNLQNSAAIATEAKLYYTFSSIWYNGANTNQPNGALTRNYFDDNGTSYTITEPDGSISLPETGLTRGWEVMLTALPYEHADLFVIIASDQPMNDLYLPAVMVKVDSGDWKFYYGLAGLKTTMPGNYIWQGNSYGTDQPMLEGVNYVRVPLNNLTPASKIAIAHAPRNTSNKQRIGLAGLQVVSRESEDLNLNSYYQRSFSSSAQWNANSWENNNVGGLPWRDSTEQLPTEAILHISGNTSVTLPASGVVADSISLRGQPTAIGLYSGTINLIGKSILNTYELPANLTAQISSTLMGNKVYLAANNPNANDSSGGTIFSAFNNNIGELIVTSGTWLVNSQLPATTPITLGGGNLLFYATQILSNPIDLAQDTNIRVVPYVTGTLSGQLSGSRQLKKRGLGSLILNGGGSLGTLDWTDASTITFSGTQPFTMNNTAINGNNVTLELYAPVAVTGCLYLGQGTIKMNDDSDITVAAMRFADGASDRTSTIIQEDCTVNVTGSDTTPTKTSTLVLSHYFSTCNYQMRSSSFIAPNANAMLTWDGVTIWNIDASEVVLKGVNMVANGGRSAIMNLADSTLKLGANGIFSSMNNGERQFNLENSTLQATEDFTITELAVSSANAINLTGSVIFDANGFTICNQAKMAGAGKLIVTNSAAGSALVCLNAASTHSGGVTFGSGSLKITHKDALGSGTFQWTGGNLLLDVGVAVGSVKLEAGKTLQVKAGDQPSWRNSGYMIADSLTVDATAENPFQVVIDLDGKSRLLTRYPLILVNGLPPNFIDKLSVSFTNGGVDLPETTTVRLEQSAEGIFIVFENTLSVQRLFWRNGVPQGTWAATGVGDDWALDSAAGTLAAYTMYDGFTLGDTDKSVVLMTLAGIVAPAYLYANATTTDYLLQRTPADDDSQLVVPRSGFTKSGAAALVLDLPLVVTNDAPFEIEAGTVQINHSLGAPEAVVYSAESEPVTIPANMATNLHIDAAGTLAFRTPMQVISGKVTGAGTLDVRDGYVVWNTSGETFNGNLTVSGGTLEITYSKPFQNSSPQIMVESGATMIFAKVDASGYGITNNTYPIGIAGTLKMLDRDTNTRGLQLYDGAQVLLQGDKDAGLDLYRTTIFKLISGSAIIKPLDAADRHTSKGAIRVRNEFPDNPRTFNVMDAAAVLTLESHLTSGATNNLVIKTGSGTLRLSSANTTKSSFRIEQGTMLFDSDTDQTLDGAFTVINGTLAKANSGAMLIKGRVDVAEGGSLLLAAVEPESVAQALRVDALNLQGVIKVSNLQDMRNAHIYPVLTTSGQFTQEILGHVQLPKNHSARLSEDKTVLSIYKHGGSLILLR